MGVMALKVGGKEGETIMGKLDVLLFETH